MERYNTVLFDVDGRVATLTLNRPEQRNAMTSEMMAEIVEVCGRVQDDPAISVLIVTGAGTAFCAGVSPERLKERMEQEEFAPVQVPASYRQNIHRIPRAFEVLEVPVIAAVNGAAVGAGVGLAVLCDIRLGSPWSRFGEVFLDLGAVPGDGSPWHLRQAVGFSRAAEMTFTARMVGAEEALEIGLLLELVPAERLLAEAHALAQRMAALAPAALRLRKRLLKLATRLSLTDYLDLTGAYQGLAFSTEDYREAIRARIENRPPQFRGR
jgi:enoyl-CoA hydratase/carnithine racemase